MLSALRLFLERLFPDRVVVDTKEAVIIVKISNIFIDNNIDNKIDNNKLLYDNKKQEKNITFLQQSTSERAHRDAQQ